MQEELCEHWRFDVNSNWASRIYLVIDGGSALLSRWIEMARHTHDPLRWSTVTQLSPGHYRVRFFSEERGTFLNCGTTGLYCERISANTNRVTIELQNLCRM